MSAKFSFLYEINLMNIFSPPASLEQTSEEVRELLSINGTDLEQRSQVTAEGRGWIVEGKPAASEANGKARFYLRSLLQIKPCANRAAPKLLGTVYSI
jgi:hypothetical protein